MKTTIKYFVLNLLNQTQFSERDIIYIPNDSLNNVANGLIEKSDHLKYFLNQDALNKENELLNSVLSTDTPLDLVIYCNFLTIDDGKKLEQKITSLKRDNLNVSICILSKIGVEKYPIVQDFCVFDGECYIAFDYKKGYFFTERIEDVILMKKWFEAPTFSVSELPNHFLHEPLMHSADMVSEAAKVLCTHDHMNSETCYWYHSVWQYLRLCNLVSTPTWHNDFYLEKIEDVYSKIGDIRVLVSGAADYSTLSYAIFCAKEKSDKAVYDVLDLCETPLFACRWYGKETHSNVNTFKMSIFDLNAIEKYNLILTDAFLTRFSRNETLDIVQRWYKSLKHNGYVITTVRIHDEKHICPEHPSKEDIEIFKNKAFRRAQIWGRYINCEPEEIANRAASYASTMVSNGIGTKEDVLSCFTNAGFKLLDVEDVELEGELYLSRYLRIFAIKE